MGHNLHYMGAWVRLVRLKQWSKNLLVFAALLFTGGWDSPNSTSRAVLAFLAMSLLASATYIFNDIRDVERDKAHPKKKSRPIAAGQVPVVPAAVFGAVLACLALALGAYINITCLGLLIFYLVQQAVYNLVLKHIAIADVFVIAIGFLVRATLGAAAVGVQISGWLLFCTGALALMLGYGKRRHEFVTQGESRTQSREALAGYNLEALNALVILSAAGAAQSYCIYSLMSKTAQAHPGLMLTSLFVVYGISRYVFLVFSAEEGGEPETLMFKDFHILMAIVGFTIASLLVVKNIIHFEMIEGMR